MFWRLNLWMNYAAISFIVMLMGEVDCATYLLWCERYGISKELWHIETLLHRLQLLTACSSSSSDTTLLTRPCNSASGMKKQNSWAKIYVEKDGKGQWQPILWENAYNVTTMPTTQHRSIVKLNKGARFMVCFQSFHIHVWLSHFQPNYECLVLQGNVRQFFYLELKWDDRLEAFPWPPFSGQRVQEQYPE